MNAKYTNDNNNNKRCVTSHLTVLDERDSVRGQVNREVNIQTNDRDMMRKEY
jgi:hypothetical protein